jgi:hypothetical protein
MSDNVENKKKERYYNPDSIKPDSIKPQKKAKDRTVIVRFRNEKDMLEFVEKTGIEVNPKIKTLDYPINDISKFM